MLPYETKRKYLDGSALMFSKVSAHGRIWILLIAWILFVGLCWADTFDLSDDVALPTGVGQPVVESDSTEQRPDAVDLTVCLSYKECVSHHLINSADRPVFYRDVWTGNGHPLYQRNSSYRI
jgi:hypothetical protein